MKNIKAMHTCHKCGKIGNVSEDIKRETVTAEDGKILQVVYYACECGAINIVQMDDERTMEYLKKASKIMIRCSSHFMDRNRKSVYKDKLNSVNSKLSIRRSKLLGKYKDTTLYLGNSGEIFIKSIDW